ncbi:class I SAM-dependent methyltransferase [Cylindrospermum sp. FACHB-282]|uniref:class I SAM-dependent methyltransferase n=1 Tax=Cylindrospermum sp. FACHB-282 TaxID=2692794 RepID=UPI0016848C20|nr:class I SAM-dependent methyltransferase [Cylindrospermum sp. FACHB-282]MBD2385334.1 class I SAM-dependent methyltransferase [Cylindrospermum sp. FACHB-282]
MTVFSPINKSSDVTILTILKRSQIIEAWHQQFQIDITEEIGEQEEIYLYRCNQTNLMFFVPFDIAGSDKLYEQLEKYDWYYMPEKWEHNVALQDLENCQKVVEVGCGRGAFVERLCTKLKLDAQGIELNSNAVKYAQKKGIPVLKLDVHDFSIDMANYFDAVCSFQVLEHISDPYIFLESLIKLVKPGGNLIISVPNAESFLKRIENHLLDQPPHHMTRWSQKSFDSLTSIFPLRVKKFRIEPLATYHVDSYLSDQLFPMPKLILLEKITRRVSHHILKPILKNSSFLRNLIPGHTLYVCFEKLG